MSRMYKYQCNYCDISLYPSDLLRHLQRLHKDENIPHCDICNKDYGSLEVKNSHDNRFHNKEHTCTICHAVFPISSRLQKHIDGVHLNIRIPCDQCTLTFTSKENLENHKREIHLKENIQCPVCNVKFNTISAYKSHYKKIHEKETYKCTECHEVCFSSVLLSEHIKRHEKNNRINDCLICDMSFYNLDEKNQHEILVHSENGKAMCNKCNKILGITSLHIHIKMVHTNELTCDICDKKATGVAELAKHKLTHIEDNLTVVAKNKVKRYICDCGEHFDKKCVYKKHLLTHLVSNPTKCELCDKIYDSVDKMRRHVQRNHNATRVKCEICELELISTDSIRRHQKSSHPELFSEDYPISKTNFAEILDCVNLPAHNLKDYVKYRAGGDTLHNTAIRFCKNDISEVFWWNSGKIPNNWKTDIHKVSDITCDNFLLTCYPSKSSIVDKKCIEFGAYVSLVSNWLKYHKINADISPTTTNFNCDKPSFDIKIAVPDTSLDKILDLLNNKFSMIKDSNMNIDYKDIDIKLDYACCPTPIIDVNLLNNTDVQKVNNRDYVGNDTYTYMIKWGEYEVRTKIYNKFSQMLKTRGVRRDIGDSIPLWIHNNGEVLNKAISNKKTQLGGLSRLEFTFPYIVPTNESIHKIIQYMEELYLPGCNLTPINNQWKEISNSLKHTLVVYDCYSGRFILSRWKSTSNKINGFESSLNKQNINSFIQLISYCSFHDLPIDIILLAPTVTYSNNGEIIERKEINLDFNALSRGQYSSCEKFNNIGLSNYRMSHILLQRSGDNKITLFNDKGNINITQKLKQGVTIKLPNIKHIIPSIVYKGVTSKIYGINLTRIATSLQDLLNTNYTLPKLIKLKGDNNEQTELLMDFDNTTVTNIHDIPISDTVYSCKSITTHNTNKRSFIQLEINDKYISVYSGYLINIFTKTPLPFNFKIVGNTSDDNQNPIPKIEFVCDNVFSAVPIVKGRTKSVDSVLNTGVCYTIKNIWKQKEKYIFTVVGYNELFSSNSTMNDKLNVLDLTTIKTIKFTLETYYIRKNKYYRFVIVCE